MSERNKELQELNPEELDTVSGGLFWTWITGPLYAAAAVVVGGAALAAGLAAEADSHK